jgi:hypothetical protein
VLRVPKQIRSSRRSGRAEIMLPSVKCFLSHMKKPRTRRGQLVTVRKGHRREAAPVEMLSRVSSLVYGRGHDSAAGLNFRMSRRIEASIPSAKSTCSSPSMAATCAFAASPAIVSARV